MAGRMSHPLYAQPAADTEPVYGNVATAPAQEPVYGNVFNRDMLRRQTMVMPQSRRKALATMRMPNVDVEIRDATAPHADLDTETITVDADTARKAVPRPQGPNGGVVVDKRTGEPLAALADPACCGGAASSRPRALAEPAGWLYTSPHGGMLMPSRGRRLQGNG